MHVEVVPYDRSWPQSFGEEAQRLAGIFGRAAIYIHHIGSTAVQGLAAKPVIDILPVVHDITAVDAMAPAFAAIGYEARGEYGLPGRRYFQKGALGDADAYHMHVYERGNPEIHRHLAFRDYLRARPQAAQDYGALKTDLARAFADDRERYLDGKDAFVRRVEQEALAWWERAPVLVLSGPPGAGKTTVGAAIADRLTALGIPHAFADLDALSEISPRSPGDRFANGFALSNLAELWRTARSCGARCLLLPCVIEDAQGAEDMRSAIPGTTVVIVRLRAPVRVLQERLHGRERGTALEWHVRRAAELAKELDRTGPADHVLDAGSAAPEALAQQALDASGLIAMLG